MENWGLITYRMSTLLYEPTVSTDQDKESVAIVIAHELAHQVHPSLHPQIHYPFLCSQTILYSLCFTCSLMLFLHCFALLANVKQGGKYQSGLLLETAIFIQWLKEVMSCLCPFFPVSPSSQHRTSLFHVPVSYFCVCYAFVHC